MSTILLKQKPRAVSLGLLLGGALCFTSASAADSVLLAQQDKTTQQGKTTQQDKTKAQGKPAQQGQAKGSDGVALLLVPIAVATSDTMNNGCWARFYADQNYQGDVLALSGPVALSNMGRVQPFWGEADSAIIGPKARVTTFDNDNYNDQTAVLQPSQRIDNLRDKLRWNEGIESVRLECTK